MSASQAGEASPLQLVAKNATQPGFVQQTGCGAGVADPTLLAVLAGGTLFEDIAGQWVMPKIPSINLLDGGRAYMQVATGLVNYCLSGPGDFYLGRIVGDALATSPTCVVNLNIDPKYDLSLDGKPFLTTVIGTQAAGGLGPPAPRGSALKFLLAATSEAEKVDALGKDGFSVAAPCVIEAGVWVVSVGSGSHPVFCFGVASGTNATAVTNVTNYLTFVLNGNSLVISVQSTDGTHTVSVVSTTVSLTVGTRFECWIDMRNPAACKLYINGLQVLSGTTFNMIAAADTLYLLAHLVKPSDTDTFEVDVDWLRARTSAQ